VDFCRAAFEQRGIEADIAFQSDLDHPSNSEIMDVNNIDQGNKCSITAELLMIIFV
jgi:hypothetical protein